MWIGSLLFLCCGIDTQVHEYNKGNVFFCCMDLLWFSFWWRYMLKVCVGEGICCLDQAFQPLVLRTCYSDMGENDRRPHWLLPLKLLRLCISYQFVVSAPNSSFIAFSVKREHVPAPISPLPAGSTSNFLTRGCYMEKGVFFPGSEGVSLGFLDLWLLQLLVSAVNSPSDPPCWGHLGIKPLGTQPLVATQRHFLWTT